MKLYDYWRSSSAWRVRIALNWKAIPYARQSVNLIAGGAGNVAGGDQHQAAFTGINPLAQVPVLELSDAETAGRGVRHITQSMAILEFLEERFPAPPLLPGDPWLRARARQLAQMVNAGIQPLQNLSTIQYVTSHLGGNSTAWISHFMSRGLAAMERAAVETAATFLVGDAVSFADLYLVPQLYTARRFSVALEGYPTLLRTEASCAALPAFAAAHADRHPDRPAAPAV